MSPNAIDMIISQLGKLDEKFDKLSNKIDNLKNNGCSKVESISDVKSSQSEIFERLRELETTAAERKGKLGVYIFIAGGIIAYLVRAGFVWVGEHLSN